MFDGYSPSSLLKFIEELAANLRNPDSGLRWFLSPFVWFGSALKEALSLNQKTPIIRKRKSYAIAIALHAYEVVFQLWVMVWALCNLLIGMYVFVKAESTLKLGAGLFIVALMFYLIILSSKIISSRRKAFYRYWPRMSANEQFKCVFTFMSLVSIAIAANSLFLSFTQQA